MPFTLHHLDGRTRTLMHDEVQYDLARGALYLSRRLSDSGRIAYVPALLDAIVSGDIDSFAATIASRRMLNPYEEGVSRRGVPFIKAVPHDAPAMLAEGEFNRFYLRGLCVRANEDGISHVEIYRAKVVYQPRLSSEMRIGRQILAMSLLADLRARPGVELALGVPNGPNSGLSARLPANSNAEPDT